MGAMTVNVAQKSRGSSRLEFGPLWLEGISKPVLPRLHQSCFAATIIRMDDQNESPQRYQWPRFVLAAFLLAVVRAIVWMCFAVHREKQERDVNAPLPGAPAR